MRNPLASLAIQGYLSDRPKISEWLSTKKPETVRLYITQIKRFEKTTQTTLETLLDQLDNHQIKPTAIRTLSSNCVSQQQLTQTILLFPQLRQT